VSTLLARFPVGQGVHLVDRTTLNSLYGVVAGIEQMNRANNPASPVNWKLKLLVVDGARSLSIKLDNLLAKGGKQSLEPIETASSFVNPKQESSIYELFDERQTEAKEKRYLVSGQVLAAKLTGKFAQVTDNQGQVHPVYFLRRGFDPEKDLDKKPIKFEKPEQINQFLFEVTQKQGVIQSDDENLTIIADIRRSNEGGLILKTPKATSQGGVYFKDEGLLGLTGDFVSKTESVHQDGKTRPQSIMAVTVPPERANEVLSYVAQKWNVGAASHKNAAREILGQTLAQWEPCSAINPTLKREVVFKTPVRTATLVQNNLQLVPDASTAQKELTNSFPLTVKSNDSPDLTRRSPFRETSPFPTEISDESSPVQKEPELTSPLTEVETNEAPPLSSQTKTVEVELKPTTDSFSAQQPTKLNKFFQGQISLVDALKLPLQPEQPQIAIALTQPHLTQPTQRKTSRRSKQTQSETQQLSLFATAEYVNQSNQSPRSPASKVVKEKAYSPSPILESSLLPANKLTTPNLQSPLSSTADEAARLASKKDQASSASNIAEEVSSLKNQQLPDARPIEVTVQPAAAHEVIENPVVKMLNQLSDPVFSQMERTVKQYFSNEPPLPPSVVEQHTLQNKVQRLDTQIASLREQHATQNKEINKLKYHPLRAFNKQYESALNQAEKTLQVIWQSLAQKELNLSQLNEWKKQDEVHQAWQNSVSTIKMRELAETLSLPSMQERLNNIHQSQLSQAQERQLPLNLNQQEQQCSRFGRER